MSRATHPPHPAWRRRTAFRPVFDWIARSDIQPVCAVYLTDLCGCDFGPAPDYPVLWVSTELTQAPFGEVIAYR